MQTTTRTSDSSKGSVKRKSFENDENESNQLPAEDKTGMKKVKVIDSNALLASNNNTKLKSSLPRFAGNNTRKQSTTSTPKKGANAANREKASNTRGAVIPDNVPATSTAAPVATANVPSTPVASTPRRPQTTERQRALQENMTSATPRISTNPFLKKIQRELVNEVTGSYLVNLIESNFNSFDERVNTVNNGLKSKNNNKWDMKDKVKRLEGAIKDLRDIIVNMQDGVRIVKESCGSYESKLVSGIREVYDHLVDDVQIIASLQSAERKMRKDLEVIQQELKQEQMKNVSHATQQQDQIRSYETQLLLKEKEMERLQDRYQHMESQYDNLKTQHEEKVLELKQHQSKAHEDVIKVYQMEIATLQVQIKKVEGDLEKSQHDYDDAIKQKQVLLDEIQSMKSLSKDVESNKDHLERDVLRLTQEVQQLKETINKKDDDLRQSMQNVYELQKQALEEKCTLRSEANAMNLRMQSLEEERRNMNNSNAQQREEIALLHRDCEQLKEAKHQLELALQQRESEVLQSKDAMMQLELEKELRVRCESREETERRERIAAVAQLMAIQAECNKSIKDAEDKYKALEETMKSSQEALSNERNEALQEVKTSTDIIVGLKKEIQQLHLALEQGPAHHGAVEELSRARGELEVLKQRLQDATLTQERLLSSDAKKMAEYEEKLRVSETQRRKLHNLVQELRGNIRVFARVRPFLPGDGYDLSQLPDPSINVRNDLNSLKIIRSNAESNKKEEHEFNFDKVFGQSCSQEMIFNEVAEFVQSALDGYHVCLFSYGQTGSGKTHTMNGSGEGSMRGIIPRAMEQVGAYKKQLQEKGWKYQMEVSFLEIYNENIRDLLKKDGKDNGKDSANDAKHEIKRDLQGNVYVTDLTRISVDPEDFQQIMSIMEMAAQQRSVSQTLMNDRSSRSHAVFTLYLKACNASQGIELNGALNLVDLAGSERVDRSGVTGSDFKETVAINKSLSSLADVFAALANKQAHVPYRNSKLTYLLQPALSGDGKTLMIVNLSPTEASFFESLSSLRFANTVSQCELGKPKRKLKDVSNESSTSKNVSFPTSSNVEEIPASAPTPSKAERPTTAAPLSAKKLNSTWEGNSLNRTKLPAAESVPLSASLGAKRPLESSSAKTTTTAKTSRTATVSRGALTSTASSRSGSVPRTPAGARK